MENKQTKNTNKNKQTKPKTPMTLIRSPFNQGEVSISISFHCYRKLPEKNSQKSQPSSLTQGQRCFCCFQDLWTTQPLELPRATILQSQGSSQVHCELSDMGVQVALQRALNPMGFPLLYSTCQNLFCTNLLSMHGFVSPLSAKSETAECTSVQVNIVFQK